MNKMPIFVIKIYFILFRIYQRFHHFFIPLFKKKKSPKVFCVGFWKTGTTSLFQAFKILGYRSGRLVKHLKKENESWPELIKRCYYDAFTDDPMSFIYKELDDAFPNSKFILTIRKTESFGKSYMNYFKGKHLEKTPEEMEKILKGYKNHIKEVKKYFKDRPDQLLIMDITKGDGWNKLCKFLEKPKPNVPFPHKNKGRYKKKN